MHPVIDYDKCVGSLACYEICPADVFEVKEKDEVKKAVVVRPEDCSECEQCVDECPTEAIELVD
ncbi:MAG: ferredoxin family protein [Methanosarcinaceae archaeon]|nr:ferredoxin family protein [Methanosarcinaceae archaeon]